MMFANKGRKTGEDFRCMISPNIGSSVVNIVKGGSPLPSRSISGTGSRFESLTVNQRGGGVARGYTKQSYKCREGINSQQEVSMAINLTRKIPSDLTVRDNRTAMFS